MSELPRIVILGPSKSGKKTLLQGLPSGDGSWVGLGRYLEFDYTKKPEQ